MIRIYLCSCVLSKIRREKSRHAERTTGLVLTGKFGTRTVWKRKISYRLKRLMFNPNVNWNSVYTTVTSIVVTSIFGSADLLRALWRLLIRERVILFSWEDSLIINRCIFDDPFFSNFTLLVKILGNPADVFDLFDGLTDDQLRSTVLIRILSDTFADWFIS